MQCDEVPESSCLAGGTDKATCAQHCVCVCVCFKMKLEEASPG